MSDSALRSRIILVLAAVCLAGSCKRPTDRKAAEPVESSDPGQSSAGEDRQTATSQGEEAAAWGEESEGAAGEAAQVAAERNEWLTSRNGEGALRVYRLDAYIAVSFLAAATDRMVIAGHGDEPAVVSGAWRASQAATALGSIGEAAELAVSEADLPGSEAGDAGSSPPEGGTLLMAPASAVSRELRDVPTEYVDSDRGMTMHLVGAEYGNLAKLFAHELEIPLEVEAPRGRFTLHIESLAMGSVFSTLMHLSGTSVEEAGEGFRLSGSKLPSRPDRLSRCEWERFESAVGASRLPVVDASVDALYVAGSVRTGDKHEVVLTMEPTYGCRLESGSMFVVREDGEATGAWRVETVGAREVELTDVSARILGEESEMQDSVTVGVPGP